MKHWLIRFYPRAWRQRYEDEFVALLEQYPLTFQDIVDIILGAFEAHLSASKVIIKEDIMSFTNQKLRVLLLLTIGVILIVRSTLRADNIILGFDFAGLAGITCLILGFAMSYQQRRQSKPLT